MAFRFSKNHHLLTATAAGVYTCGSDGVTEIFTSGSKGIVAVERTANGSGLLAVADSHLIIIHDIRQGMRKSYRLRSADGQVCMLRYAKDPDRLLFTTSLSNAIQAYDLETSTLLEPMHDHPTPPTLFALSSTSHLLLSASASPVVIQLTNLLLSTRPLLLRPQCSSAPVVVTEFHPERGNIFLLVFADGACAAYDAAHIFRNSGKYERKSYGSTAGDSWEIAQFKDPFTSGDASYDAGHDRTGHTQKNAPQQNAVSGDNSRDIMAAAFIPGQKATAVTLASDGKCCVVEFAVSEAGHARLISAWDVGSPATCLSVLASNSESGSLLPIARGRNHIPIQSTIVIAIGRSDGHVLFFDLDGNHLATQTIAQGILPIISVAWMQGSDWPKPVYSYPIQTTQRRFSSDDRESLGAVLAGHRPVTEEIMPAKDDLEINQEAQDTAKVSLPNEDPSYLAKQHGFRRFGDDDANRPSSAPSQMEYPSTMRHPYPAQAKHDDTSGIADTSSSGSLQSMLRNFQFPNPPINNLVYAGTSPKSDVRQLPRNNSWARELPSPIIGSSRGIQIGRPATADNVSRGTTGNLIDEHDLTERPPLRELSTSSSRSNRQIVVMHTEPKTINATDNIKQGAGTESFVDQPDVWVDVADDQTSPDENRDSAPFNKENAHNRHIPTETWNGSVVATGSGPVDQMSRVQPGKRLKQAAMPEGGFTIHVDDHGQIIHPQPLQAHPRESSTPGPGFLAPINLNTSRQSSMTRTPWYRQKSRVGNGPNYRSSIYGPGSLARKVQQEVMITVNIELDVLRREMNVKFAEQKTWFEHEIKESQVWAVRVEEENRKLREELAKERKRREGAGGGGGRGLC
ncbi:MAG: hypothetical protein Q9220_006533 [cf. Caloplaca sp. 1 TL-2023]